MSSITLYYFHDPMCSWCWGYSKTLRELRGALPANLGFSRILGGLAADTTETMPLVLQQQIQNSWHRIEDMIPDVKFNFDYWTKCQPRRSTYPACRAVIAAREQGQQYDELMTKAIQAAYYQQARNTSLDDTLTALAEEIGLEVNRFTAALNSETTRQKLIGEINFARELDVDSFPSLRLVIDDKALPIAVDYLEANITLSAIQKQIDKHS